MKKLTFLLILSFLLHSCSSNFYGKGKTGCPTIKKQLHHVGGGR